MLSSSRRSTASNRTAVGVGDHKSFGRWSGRFSERVFRLRKLMGYATVMLLVAFAIVGPWGLLLALFLWLVHSIR